MRTRWGQNFLVSPAAALRIVESLRLVPEDRVIEIGPGRGILTLHLLPRCASLTAVELDQYLATTLNARWGHEKHLTVVCQDFLNWTLPATEGRPWKVIGNLPYSAGGSILRKVLDWTGWDRAVFMVQKEVAARIVAPPGGRDYGILTLAVQAKAEARRLFDVSPGSFRPSPRVTSTVVELARLEDQRVPPELEPDFFRVVRAAFGQRRKILLNSLAQGLGLPKAELEAILQGVGLRPGDRPERIPLGGYLRLVRTLANPARSTSAARGSSEAGGGTEKGHSSR